jgi:hypothetical protein
MTYKSGQANTLVKSRVAIVASGPPNPWPLIPQSPLNAPPRKPKQPPEQPNPNQPLEQPNPNQPPEISIPPQETSESN